MNRLKSKLRTASKWAKVHWIWLLSGSVTLLLALVILSNIFPESPWLKWTGFGEDKNESEEKTFQIKSEEKTFPDKKHIATKEITLTQSGKTLWDWMGLAGVIAIPVILFQFQQQQQKSSEELAKLEKERSEELAKLEKERSEAQAKVEKEIADTNLREEALKDYIDKIAELLIDKELKVLLEKLSEKDLKIVEPKLDAILDIARARTLSILRRLGDDGERKGSVVRFLIDAELGSLDLLKDANLRQVNLKGAKLQKANLKRAILSEAILSEADLSEAILSNADLSEAILSNADLSKAILSEAILSNADLSNADLSNADIRNTDLSNVDIRNADLLNADIRNANITIGKFKAAKNWHKANYDLDFKNQVNLAKRIDDFRQRFYRMEPLGCEDVDFSENLTIEDLLCPICNNTAKGGTESVIDVDHRENIIDAYPVVSAIKCDVCGFSTTDFDEIKEIFEILSSENEEKVRYKDSSDMSDEFPI